MVVVVMGVCGCGKTSVAKAIAERRNMNYLEGDSFHPEANVQKMSSGIPLTEDDRGPWLHAIQSRIRQAIEKREDVVVTCSALSRNSRTILRDVGGPVHFVFLSGSRELISGRLQSREGHYMPAELLQSQFDALETPTAEEAFEVSIEVDLEQVVERVAAVLDEVERRS